MQKSNRRTHAGICSMPAKETGHIHSRKDDGYPLIFTSTLWVRTGSCLTLSRNTITFIQLLHIHTHICRWKVYVSIDGSYWLLAVELLYIITVSKTYNVNASRRKIDATRPINIRPINILIYWCVLGKLLVRLVSLSWQSASVVLLSL